MVTVTPFEVQITGVAARILKRTVSPSVAVAYGAKILPTGRPDGLFWSNVMVTGALATVIARETAVEVPAALVAVI